jgi:threonine/homoserine/homoserine lactone efflux protein
MTDPLQFVLAVLLLLGVPGPTNTVMATAGAVNRGEGRWRAMAAELGGYLGIVVLARVAILPLIDLWPWVGVILKCAAVVFLGYAALALWRARLHVNGSAGDRVRARLIFITTFLNPKGLIIAIGILPRAHPMLLAYFAVFAVLVLATGAAWFMAGRVLGTIAGRRANLLPRAGSLALVGFAGYLVTTIVA